MTMHRTPMGSPAGVATPAAESSSVGDLAARYTAAAQRFEAALDVRDDVEEFRAADRALTALHTTIVQQQRADESAVLELKLRALTDRFERYETWDGVISDALQGGHVEAALALSVTRDILRTRSMSA